MRRFALVVGLLCSTALPAQSDDKKQPLKAPPDYIKVEIRGKLGVADAAGHPMFDIEELAKQPLSMTAGGMRLSFGANKDLAALAKKLDGKSVVVTGTLGRWSPPTAARSPVVVFYIHVTAMKAADDESDRPVAESERPKISMTDASSIAEKYVQREMIDVSEKFVALVRYVDDKVAETTQVPYWQVTYEPVRRSTLGGEVWVSVGMDGKCSHEFGK